MKTPHFENVADKLFADLQEKQYRQRAWDRKKFYAPDNKYSIFERVGIIAGSLIFAIAMVCLIILNAEAIDNFSEIAITFIGSIPTWGWTIFTLLGCSFSAWFLITRKRARG